MTDTYTEDHYAKLKSYLANHKLPSGLGTKKSACTLAAINLAMTGELTDKIPNCMSEVLGKAAIRLQDAMPVEMRNSARYKDLIPNMPGTGRDQEEERLAVLMDWMWKTVLPQVQPIADKNGFGAEWHTMCKIKTVVAAYASAEAAYAARAVYAAYAAYASYAADAADAARAARAAAAAVGGDFWNKVDPIGVLERMTYLEERND